MSQTHTLVFFASFNDVEVDLFVEFLIESDKVKGVKVWHDVPSDRAIDDRLISVSSDAPDNNDDGRYLTSMRLLEGSPAYTSWANWTYDIKRTVYGHLTIHIEAMKEFNHRDHENFYLTVVEPIVRAVEGLAADPRLLRRIPEQSPLRTALLWLNPEQAKDFEWRVANAGVALAETR